MGCLSSQPETVVVKSSIDTAASSLNQPSKRIRKNIFGAIQAKKITEHYKILKAIGSGTIGTLFYASHLKTQEFRTLREINKLTIKDEAESVSQEVKILKELDHPNIRKVFECIETPKNYYIAMEYIDGQSLNEKIKSSGCETYLFKVILEVFDALSYLHQKGIAHCNICPEYVIQVSLEGYDTQTKIVGFLAAQRLNDKQDIQYEKLKFQYSSPELLRGEYDEKTDMWSCGVLLYELAVGRLPFPAKTKAGIIECILNGHLDFSNSLFTSLSISMQNLIINLMDQDPSRRMATSVALCDSNYTSCTNRIKSSLNALSCLKKFKVNTAASKSLLLLINSRIGKDDHDIVSYFKELDENFDGKVSKDELIDAYLRLGIDITAEADDIMNNMDLTGNGFIDYAELKISLIKWGEELKEKNLSKIFNSESRILEINALRYDLIDVKQTDWIQFLSDCPNDGNFIHLSDLKRYLRINIEQ